jgi:hypothetical protein
MKGLLFGLIGTLRGRARHCARAVLALFAIFGDHVLRHIVVDQFHFAEGSQWDIHTLYGLDIPVLNLRLFMRFMLYGTVGASPTISHSLKPHYGCDGSRRLKNGWQPVSGTFPFLFGTHSARILSQGVFA